MKLAVESVAVDCVSADWVVLAIAEKTADQPLAVLGRGPQGIEAQQSLTNLLTRLVEGDDFHGKHDDLLPVYGLPGWRAERVLLVGAGALTKNRAGWMGRLGGRAAKFLRGHKHQVVAFDGFHSAESMTEALLTQFVVGAAVGATGQDLYRRERKQGLQELRLLLPESVATQFAPRVDAMLAVAQAVNLCRRLVNESPAHLYPETFCRQAQALVDERGPASGLTLEVFDPGRLAEERMGCILAVGGGSSHSPRLLVIRYDGPGTAGQKPLGLVGKGVTFDSGGVSLKTAEGMVHMKCDMAGAATVLAATLAIADQSLPVRVLAVMPLVENMPSATSYRTGDVLTARNGKTIEIVNTDAEGRLILADALSWTVDQGAGHVVDLATLTGACVIALGTDVAGLMSNDPPWSTAVSGVADGLGEYVWPLPMYPDYDKLISSGVADMKNSGGRHAGAITAAKLLVEFVGDTPWVHLDIAGTAFHEKPASHRDAGATGCFVHTLVELARRYSVLVGVS